MTLNLFASSQQESITTQPGNGTFNLLSAYAEARFSTTPAEPPTVMHSTYVTVVLYWDTAAQEWAAYSSDDMLPLGNFNFLNVGPDPHKAQHPWITFPVVFTGTGVNEGFHGESEVLVLDASSIPVGQNFEFYSCRAYARAGARSN